MKRQTGSCVLPSRRRVDVAALARACAPPWHAWARGALARAERTADGRVHLVVVRRHPAGVSLSVTGVGAADGERMAPLAARMRRALALDATSALRGTSAFEDAVVAALRDAHVSKLAWRRLLALGRRCPAAPALRTMPGPADLLAVDPDALASRLGSGALALRLQTFARAFAAGAPSAPIMP